MPQIPERTHHEDATYAVGRSTVHVGRFSYGLHALKVHQWGEGADLHVGRFCSLAGNVQVFLGGNHRVDWATTYPFGHIHRDRLGGAGIAGHPATRGDVRIGHDVWIGMNAVILSGVTIGDGAVIGTGAVVGRDVPPYEIWSGNPAQRIRARFDPQVTAALLDLAWWDLPEAEVRRIAPDLSRPPEAEAIRALARRVRRA